MNWRRIAVGTVAVGIVMNIVDYVLNTYVLTGVMASMASISNQPDVTMYVLGDFAGAFMLMLAWDKVGSLFGQGAAAGAKFGLAAGLFISFPMVLFVQMQIRGFPYQAAWVLICAVALNYAVCGAVAAALDRKAAS